MARSWLTSARKPNSGAVVAVAQVGACPVSSNNKAVIASRRGSKRRRFAGVGEVRVIMTDVSSLLAVSSVRAGHRLAEPRSGAPDGVMAGPVA